MTDHLTGAAGRNGLLIAASSTIDLNGFTVRGVPDSLNGITATIGRRNMVARNRARGNAAGNFSVSAANELAPVIINPGSNAFATATPWSNFSF